MKAVLCWGLAPDTTPSGCRGQNSAGTLQARGQREGSTCSVWVQNTRYLGFESPEGKELAQADVGLMEPHVVLTHSAWRGRCAPSPADLGTAPARPSLAATGWNKGAKRMHHHLTWGRTGCCLCADGLTLGCEWRLQARGCCPGTP